MKNLKVPFCTIEQIVGKLEKLQGEKRGRIGRTRMEDLEMLANVIQSQDTIGKKKNPSYGRHWISRRLRLVALNQNGWKQLKRLKSKNGWKWMKTIENSWKRMKSVENGWKWLKTVENGWKWVKMVENIWKRFKQVEIGWKHLKTIENGWKRSKTIKNSKKTIENKVPSF